MLALGCFSSKLNVSLHKKGWQLSLAATTSRVNLHLCFTVWMQLCHVNDYYQYELIIKLTKRESKRESVGNDVIRVVSFLSLWFSHSASVA